MDMKSTTLSDRFDETIEKIWSRAHIPEFASDAKTVIKHLFKSELQTLLDSLVRDGEEMKRSEGRLNSGNTAKDTIDRDNYFYNLSITHYQSRIISRKEEIV